MSNCRKYMKIQSSSPTLVSACKSQNCCRKIWRPESGLWMAQRAMVRALNHHQKRLHIITDANNMYTNVWGAQWGHATFETQSLKHPEPPGWPSTSPCLHRPNARRLQKVQLRNLNTKKAHGTFDPFGPWEKLCIATSSDQRSMETWKWILRIKVIMSRWYYMWQHQKNETLYGSCKQK